MAVPLVAAAAGAAGTGGMSAGMGALYGSLISGGLGMLGGLFNKGGEQKTGYDIVRMPQYSWTEPNRKLSADFVAQNIQRLSQGLMPTYMQKALPSMRTSMMRPLDLAYYGRAGQRGTSIYGATQAAGAMSGLGPKSLMSATAKTGQDYADKASAIDEYLNNLVYQTMSRDVLAFPEMQRMQQYGPETSIVAYGGSATQPQAPMSGLMSSLGSAIGQNMAQGNFAFQKPPVSTAGIAPQTTPAWYSNISPNAGSMPYNQASFNPASYAAPANYYLGKPSLGAAASNNLAFLQPAWQGAQNAWNSWNNWWNG